MFLSLTHTHIYIYTYYIWYLDYIYAYITCSTRVQHPIFHACITRGVLQADLREFMEVVQKKVVKPLMDSW